MGNKLLLINPLQKNSKTMGKEKNVLNVPPLSLAYVAALTPDNWDIEILDETENEFISQEADLVGITSFTHNVPRAYEILVFLKKRGISTIMGGIHASALTKEALEFADAVVVGDAFDTWPSVIKDFENNSLKRVYESKKPNLEGIVTPRRDLFPKESSLTGKIATVQTAIGCPFGCNFCSVSQLYGKKYRTRPINQVLDELEELQTGGTNKIFFVDDNIVGYGPKAEQRALSLFKGMVERGLSLKWAGQASVNIGDNQSLLEYAEKSGCSALFIGFESLNPTVLKKMGKTPNIKANNGDYKPRINMLHHHGIAVIGGFIFGNDEDTKEVFDITRDFVFSTGIDVTQYAPLTPLPGTRLYSDMLKEGRLLFTNYPNDWALYDFAHVVGKPRGMTSKELSDGLTRLCNESFSLLPAIKRAGNTLRNTGNMYSTIYSFAWNRAFNKGRINSC